MLRAIRWCAKAQDGEVVEARDSLEEPGRSDASPGVGRI
jgi:hypothetical protein